MVPWVALPTLLWMLTAGCAPAPPVPLRPHLAAYQGFLVATPLLPFRASGSVLFHHGDTAESGTMVLVGSRAAAFRLQLHARLTGALAADLRFDAHRLLFLDHTRETYFLGPNGPEQRRALFSLDVSPEEFLVIVTGRVPQAAFADGAGRFHENGTAEFSRGGFRYRFQLDGHGLPRRWVKERGGSTVYQVEYRGYSESPLGNGTSLRLPQKIRVGVPGRPSLLVLGFREFEPAQAPLRPIDFAVPRGERWQATPLP